MPLHGGKVPEWLAQRMSRLGAAMAEIIITDYGRANFISRLSDPFWFQSFGCVMGMDWHSSGITSSVMAALKRGLNPKAHDLGIYVCGGRGKYSRATPTELLQVAEKTGLNGNKLAYTSRLTAKVDNTAIQDGFQLYLHSFIVSKEGHWAVVQQGMNTNNANARRYHWHSEEVKSFVNEPHTSIYGPNQGLILNLTASEAEQTRSAMLQCMQDARQIQNEIRHLSMSRDHQVKDQDVNLKRLGAMLAMAEEQRPETFEQVLMQEGMGPRSIQSLALVSEIVHGTPSRFQDPARFSFAHGGKDGYPFPVPTKVYDNTIDILEKSILKAKLGINEQQDALKKLHKVSKAMEENFLPTASVEKVIDREWQNTSQYGGRTVKGWAKNKVPSAQLKLF